MLNPPVSTSQQLQLIQRQFKTLDFEFIEQIGMGKFGIIYKAKQVLFGQIVAIKIIPKKKIEDIEMYERLKNQIEVHSRLKFPYICQLYSYFHDQNNIYLVMEYCANSSLYFPIKIENKYFTQKEIAKLMHQFLSSIDYLQKRSVIHKDIKLENLLLDEDYNLKLSDFGCCAHTKKEQQNFCGTLEYICPQMVGKSKYTNKVDIYCAGIVLYELFYFVSPFKGETEEETFKLIEENKIHFNDYIRVVPDLAKSLILEMLCKDPNKRPTPEKALAHEFFKYYLNEKENLTPESESKV